MDIERLRALADWCNDRQVHWAAQEGDYAQGRVNAFCEAEYEIRQSIAELGQEVGAVAWEWRWIGDATEDPGPWNLCDNEGHAMLIANTSGYEVRHRPPSPAHTSEARDAELLDWLRVNEFDLVTRREDIGEDEYAIWWFVVDYRKSTRTNLHTVSGHPLGSPREAIIAAMERQNEARREASSRSAR